MNIIREALINRRLHKALQRHRGRLAGGIKSLRDGASLSLAPNVKLGKAKIYSAALEIGAYTDVVSGCEFSHVSRIGRFCSIATGVVIGQSRRSHPMDWLTTHHFPFSGKLVRNPAQAPVRIQPVEIGHDVWIGRDALILDSVKIGTGAIIGAKSLVTADVPAYAIVAGTPARVIRYRFEPELIELLLASRWWELPLEVLAELPLDDPQACLAQLERREPVVSALPRLRVRSRPFVIDLLPA